MKSQNHPNIFSFPHQITFTECKTGEESKREKEENGNRKKVDWGWGNREHAVCPKRVGGSKSERVREKERGGGSQTAA